MNVYDFDGTIYDGDSSLDFFLFCLKKGKVGIICLLKILFSTPLYLIKVISTKKYKQIFFSFLKKLKNPDELIEVFWVQHVYKINNEMDAILRNRINNIIITASPEFLVSPIAIKYNCKIIGTRMNVRTGIITGNNCSGDEKIKRLNQNYSDVKIFEFYTDSLKDKPLAKLAKESYMVVNKKIVLWNEKILKFKKRKNNILIIVLLFFIVCFSFLLLQVF